MSVTDYSEFKPRDYYYKTGKNEFINTSKEYIEKLVKEKQFDIQQNKEYVKKINTLLEKIKKFSNSNKWFKVLSGFLVLIASIAIVCFIVGIILCVTKVNVLSILLIVIGALVAIGCLLIIFLVLKKKIQDLSKKLEILKKEKDTLIAKAKVELDKILYSLNFSTFIDILNKCTNNFKLDRELEPIKLKMIEHLFKFNTSLGKDDSIYEVQSGLIEKNPFIRILVHYTSKYNHVYTGSRTVSYTVHYYDSKGNSHTSVRTETLVASYTAPASRYGYQSYVIYGNSAAPDLVFSRRPSGFDYTKGEKALNKFVKNKEKEILEKEKKATLEGKNFHNLANTEFEALFYALNRNNEPQYRILFTPLGQINMTDLISKETPYGDDFNFDKIRKINIISTLHSRNKINFDYTAYYPYYDYEEFVKDFINDITESYTSLYFDLAPILSIPIYQLSEPSVYDPKEDLENISLYEAESISNKMDYSLFKHKDAKTDQILKAKYLYSSSNSDVYNITSYAYNKIPHTVFIPVVANNGVSYDVPVTWYEYIPVQKDSKVAITKLTSNKGELLNEQDKYRNLITYRNKNLVSMFLGDSNLSTEDDKIFKDLVDNRYNKY